MRPDFGLREACCQGQQGYDKVRLTMNYQDIITITRANAADVRVFAGCELQLPTSWAGSLPA
jgi:hypothetical protein